MSQSDRIDLFARCPELTRRMELSYARLADPKLWVAARVELGVTLRELEVGLGLLRGWSLAEIGRRLKISRGTVRIHCNRLYRTLRVHNRCELVVVLLLASGVLLSQDR